MYEILSQKISMLLVVNHLFYIYIVSLTSHSILFQEYKDKDIEEKNNPSKKDSEGSIRDGTFN